MSFLRKELKNYKSFLIINPFGIGDVLFSTPLIRNLAKNFPLAKIYYLANRKTALLLIHHPLISKVFVYERDEFTAQMKKSGWLGLKKYAAFIKEIRNEKIDAAIDLSLNTPFGFIAMMSGIKERFGLDYKNRGLFLTHKLKILGFCDKHVVEYYLSVLKLLGIELGECGLEVYPGEQNREWARDYLKRKGINRDKLIFGIAPCGGDAFGKDANIKRWPAEKFAALIVYLLKEYPADIFLFAGPKEKDDVAQIIKAAGNSPRIHEFTDCSLAQTVALLEFCGLFIGNDTGPMRFADGLGKKIVALFGPVDEKIYGPYPADEKRALVIKKDLACRPCYRKLRLTPCLANQKCLRDIEVEEVAAAIKKLL